MDILIHNMDHFLIGGKPLPNVLIYLLELVFRTKHGHLIHNFLGAEFILMNTSMQKGQNKEKIRRCTHKYILNVFLLQKADILVCLLFHYT